MIRRTSDNRLNGDHARAIVCPVAIALGDVVAKKSDRNVRDPGLAAVAT
jgi:hypothetical protein